MVLHCLVLLLVLTCTLPHVWQMPTHDIQLLPRDLTSIRRPLRGMGNMASVRKCFLCIVG